MLSRAGRRTLVQSVLNAIPVYIMQTSLLPKSVCNQLDRISRNYLWGASKVYAYNHLVHCERVSLPKRFGGLCIRLARNTNLALLAWAIDNNSTSFPHMLLRNKYLQGRDFGSASSNSLASLTWKSILKSRSVFEKGYKMVNW